MALSHPHPEFGQGNPIVKRCLQGMDLKDSNKSVEARDAFLQAWHEATLDLEKFITAFFLSSQEQSTQDKLGWLETALLFAMNIHDDTVRPAFPELYRHISHCH